MRGAILRQIKLFAMSTALCLASAYGTLGQVQGRYDSLCPRLGNASASELLDFLDGVNANKENAWCITLAIHNLGTRRYEPAIGVLIRLLDFRRPRTPKEEAGFSDLSSAFVFPAEGALEEIGKMALPEILRAIEADSTSATARENAVSVWMEAYKYERPRGIALLKHEETQANNNSAKERLSRAVQRALTKCGPAEETACKEAAAGHPAAR
jgi:hypothetical protein